MAETPETDLADPDLDAPGEPIRATLALEDGTQLPYEIPRPSGTTASRSLRGRAAKSL